MVHNTVAVGAGAVGLVSWLIHILIWTLLFHIVFRLLGHYPALWSIVAIAGLMLVRGVLVRRRRLLGRRPRSPRRRRWTFRG